MDEKRVLEGIRVLDLTQAYSGPFCTMNLADNGAEVIKIERPETGDQTRTWGPFKNGYSAYFAYINRNKKGVTLDLSKEEGKELFKKLVVTADVVCENFRVGTMEKLGLGYEVLKKLNPKLIYASISGFGLEGHYAKRACYDIIAQGMSGMMSVTGYPDAPPVKIGPSVGDSYSGAYLCMGVSMALYKREKTGEGQRIDVAMVDTLYSTLENFVVEYTVGKKTPKRAGNIDPGIAPFDSFQAKDADFVMGCGTNKMFAKLCEAMGRNDLIENPLYSTNVKRCENYLPELKNIVESWSRTKTVAELEYIMVEAGIPFGPILDIPQITEHTLIQERNMIWEVEQPGMDSKIRIPGCPIKMHGKPDYPQKAAPLLGEDNLKIYSEIAGLSKYEIDKLILLKVI